jgi:long-chain acyl-CoA synthetase
MPLSGPPLQQPVRLSQLLRPALETKPDELALVSVDTRWSWREIDRYSNRLAGHLLGLGLQPGNRVASLMPNCPALLIHYLACIKAGLVAVPLNYRYMPPEIDHALGVSGASVLFAHAERDQDLAGSKRASRLPLGRIHCGDGDGRSPRFEELIQGDPPSSEFPVPEANAPAAIFFTSGSTGPAKGVTHTCETLGWVVASALAGLEYTADDVFLTGSSLSHEGGVEFSFAALAAGARVVIARTFDSDELLPLLRTYRPTVVWMLPATLIRLVHDQGACREDFSSLRLCMSGGDRASPDLEREFTNRTGLAIHETYGMTEIGCATINPPSGVNKPGSIGCLSPGYEMSIRDENGTERLAGAEGRLWIRSPCVMVGYWGDPEASQETIRDGWLDTGDVMTVDADGYLWFRGRKKQIIVHDGSNICPGEVEAALLEHPAVESAAVVGVHDLVHGENVRAYVTLKDGADRPASQELIRFARARVGYKAPEEIILLDRLPLNAAGKVDRVTLKRMAEAGLNRLSQ